MRTPTSDFGSGGIARDDTRDDASCNGKGRAKGNNVLVHSVRASFVWTHLRPDFPPAFAKRTRTKEKHGKRATVMN